MPRATPFPPHIRIVRDRAPYGFPQDLPRLSDPAAVSRFLGPLLNREEVEVFVVLHLNTRSNVIGYSEITRGLVDCSLVHPREVFRHVIAAGASGCILAHNHPSGDPTPSSEDRAVTRQLVAAGQLLDLPVLDHVIMAGDRFLSFVTAGLL